MQKTLINSVKPMNGENVVELPFKYVVFPRSRNEILIRFENIGDKFDRDEQQLIVDVYNFTKALFDLANAGKAELNSINILEVSLTGNQKYTDMVKSKTNWKV